MAPENEPLARAFARTIGAYFGEGEPVDAQEVLIAAAGVITSYLAAVDDPIARRRLRAKVILAIAEADRRGGGEVRP